MSISAAPLTLKLALIIRIRHMIFQHLARETSRYIIVGGIIYVADFLIYLLVVTFSTSLFIEGNIIGRIVGAIIGFFLHKHWTFKGKQIHSTKKQIVNYFLLLLFNIFLSSTLLAGFNLYWYSLGSIWSRIFTDVLIIIFTFVCSRFIFRRHKVNKDTMLF